MDTVSSAQRSRNMAAVRGRDTTPERAVRSALHALGLRFRLHQASLPGSPDIVLRRHQTVVLVHGCFWHGHDCPRGKVPSTRPDFWLPKLAGNRQRDGRQVKELQALGWRVLVVWECETKDQANLSRRLAKWFRVA
jgi:DNA mismatch endonuclease, patch repair protein